MSSQVPITQLNMGTISIITARILRICIENDKPI